jgi:hypothetical protein
MDLDRRSLLAGGLAYVGMAGLPCTVATGDPAIDQVPHPFTRSLFERAFRAGIALDRLEAERVIRQRAELLGRSHPPVIKWLPGPQAAFDHLSRQGLTSLLQMESATFWRQPDGLDIDQETLDRWCVVRRLATEVVRPDDHDRALMAPKLVAKQCSADPDAAFEARAVAAQVGWLETSIPDATVEALCRVEVLLSQGLSEVSESVRHQLGIIEAYQHGLLATWETPAELVCVPRIAVV